MVNFRVDLNIDDHQCGLPFISWARALAATVFSSCDNWLLLIIIPNSNSHQSSPNLYLSVRMFKIRNVISRRLMKERKKKALIL